MKKYIFSQLLLIFLFNATVLAQKKVNTKTDSVKTSVTDSIALVAKRARITQELKEIELFIQLLGEIKQKEYETLTDPKKIMREFYNWKALQLNQ